MGGRPCFKLLQPPRVEGGRDQAFSALTATILAMRRAVMPDRDPDRHSVHSPEKHSAHYRVMARFYQSYCNDKDGSPAVVTSFPALGAFANRVHHTMALVALRDGVKRILDEQQSAEEAPYKLNMLLATYRRECPDASDVETEAVRLAVASLTTDCTNEKAREAVQTISHYTHTFLNGFEKNLIREYKKDRKTLRESTPQALQQSSEMLDCLNDIRWAKAADQVFDLLTTYAHTFLASQTPERAPSGGRG